MTLKWTQRESVFAPYSFQAREDGIIYRVTPLGFNVKEGAYSLDIITPYKTIPSLRSYPTLEAAQKAAEDHAEERRQK